MKCAECGNECHGSEFTSKLIQEHIIKPVYDALPDPKPGPMPTYVSLCSVCSEAEREGAAR